MGGRDKPLLSWRNKAMVDWVLESVPRTMPRLISANRNLDRYRTRGTVVADEKSAGSGPLAGVLSAWRVCNTHWMLVAPGDAPDIPDLWWQVMFTAAAAHNHHCVVHDGERQQHLHLLLHRQCVAGLQDFLAGGYFQVFLWLQELNPQIVQFDNPSRFRNLNSPTDLRRS